MRNLTHLNVPKDSSASFPFNTIQNETATQEGTPVYRELYGDVLTNIWKIIDSAGIEFTGTEDSDYSQYQLLDALRKFTNELNDIEKNISLLNNVWVVDLDLSILPNKYVFIANSSNDWDSSINYQFKGSGDSLLGVTSVNGFKAGDEVVVVLDSSGVRIYSLSFLAADSSESYNFLASPLSFNNTETVYYLNNGVLFTNGSAVYNIQESIIDLEQNNNLILSDAIVFNTKLICLVYDSLNLSYRVFTFNTSDLSTPLECVYNGFNVVSGENFHVYMYSDGESVYFTNGFNTTSNDYTLFKTVLNLASNTLTYTASIPLNPTVFKKTTNTVILNNKLYHFIGVDLKSHDLSTLTATTIFDNYSLFSGVLFSFNSEVLFSVNGVTTKFII